MIVPMKQVTVAAASSDQAATLRSLQDAGTVHLVETAKSTTDRLTIVRARLEAARHAAGMLAAAAQQERKGRRAPDEARPPGTADRRSAEEVVTEVERLASRLDDLRSTREELAQQQQRLALFGAFDPIEVRRLASQGVGVRLSRPPVRRPPESVEDAVWIELARDREHLALALVGDLETVEAAEVPDEVPLPTDSPQRIQQLIEEVERDLGRTREGLAALSERRLEVERWLQRTEDELRFEEARAAMETLGAVSLLRGFVPEDEVERLSALARERGWGLWVTDVADDAAAPTLIRNPRWVESIRPVFGFLGIVPAYGQVDISLPFLVFFSIFFAIIVGDAGYGLVFLALTELARRRLPSASPNVIRLLRMLSLGTIAWGVATGSYFGVALPGVFAALQLGWLTDERNVMTLAFTIGVLHLTLAHGWNIVRFSNSTRALVELGWIFTTWTMYFLARQLVVGDPFPPLAWASLAIGVTLIVLFITPWRKLRSEWFTHAMLPLNLVSNFVDVVSYVRLFAVGAATFAVAEAFNDLALSIGLGGVVGGLVSALVLFFGHTLNVLLAAMGVLVHGVRLNTLEFAGHLGLSWTGYPYRPFARVVRADAEGEATWNPR
jgi:V/A-type H+/Na+-transporting ATPase subunit I